MRLCTAGNLARHSPYIGEMPAEAAHQQMCAVFDARLAHTRADY